MTDKFSKEVRSNIMSNIRSKNTQPELQLRSKLHKFGYRYSLHYKFISPNFTPDIVMVSRKVVIFIDGCFWHKCPKCYRQPKSNKKYWLPKIERNVQRDKAQDKWLKKNGWDVIRIWEHEIRKDLDGVLYKIVRQVDK